MSADKAETCASGLVGRMPCVYVNHGGGPMPLLGQQPGLASFLSGYASTLPSRPSAILVVSAHWEATAVKVTAADKHPLLFDYSGFPAESYRYTYAAPGSPSVAARVKQLLNERSIACDLEVRRGWDHGVFVPMMLMFPEAQVPVVELSLLESQAAARHVEVGEALQPLREEGVLIVGSGVSFHNMRYFFSSGATQTHGISSSRSFSKWLCSTITSTELTEEERKAQLSKWEQAPAARECHPPGAAEHLMPLFVVAGAAGCGPGRIVGAGELMMGFQVDQFEFP